MPESPSISLIVTGGARQLELHRLFGSISAQANAPKVELLFVEQTEGCSLALKELGPAIEYRVISTRRTIPLSRARNLALQMGVRGEIVAFPDDDCWYPNRLLRMVVDRFRLYPEMDCLCVNVRDPNSGRNYGHRPTDGKCRVTFVNVFKLPISVGMFVRRSSLERAGKYFDENLGAGTPAGSGEESEVLCRLLATGAQVWYDGSLSVFHPDDDLLKVKPARCFGYGFGFGVLHRRLLGNGHIEVLIFLMEVLARSVCGGLFHVRNATLRQNYLARARGILAGLFNARASRA